MAEAREVLEGNINTAVTLFLVGVGSGYNL